MGNLQKFSLPPLVREVEITTTFPGYRYIYFKSFGELTEYFGVGWEKEPWARYWTNSEKDLAREDEKLSRPLKKGVMPYKHDKDSNLYIESRCTYPGSDD